MQILKDSHKRKVCYLLVDSNKQLINVFRTKKAAEKYKEAIEYLYVTGEALAKES